MIRIHLDEPTRERTRLAISPLREVVSGVELVHRTRQGRDAPWPYAEWAAHAAEVLRATPETGPLRLYALLYGTEHARPTPDAVQPPPPSARPALADELALLRSTPHEVIAAQCAKHYPEGVPDVLRSYLDSTADSFGRLADAVEAFWELAIAPHWPAMRAVLEEEIVLRARVLAEHGPEAVLRGLSGTAGWDAPVLSLPKRRESALAGGDRRLLLVPLVLACDRATVSTDDPATLMITYPARGAAVLSARTAPAPPDRDRLALLIGAGRAAVLRALTEPATTSGLAAVLGRAPSTVSEQLTGLQEAGLVSRSRVERQVFYRLEPLGASLLALFTAQDSVPAEPMEGRGGPA
ncbi:ArsR/SmtB family transcription factor [Catenuloplanes atrovinosus]|uniref:DNA-binding transcriptional ArsR family regulator n=1 Tax=Catenuloplanes atrovinosus TaxID=137266 RepID=A0AAE3YQ57_9ACTN|nr:helix-turn-helix domain-containing protein [Catenuloplanes atrovinosus]MDR7276556.1 DNA-binding transcriptional ArsR family regulator [Catenuloplanes atrovinosus]